MMVSPAIHSSRQLLLTLQLRYAVAMWEPAVAAAEPNSSPPQGPKFLPISHTVVNNVDEAAEATERKAHPGNPVRTRKSRRLSQLRGR